MLELDSPRWADFATEGVSARLVPEHLKKLSKAPTDADWDEVFELIASQWTLSASAWPATPHLVRLLEEQKRLARRDSLLGLARCACPLECESECPDDLCEEFDAALATASSAATRLASEPGIPAADYAGVLCAAAALMGSPKLGQLSISAAFFTEAEIPVCCPKCEELLTVVFGERNASASVKLEDPEGPSAMTEVAFAEAGKPRGADLAWALGLAQQAGQEEAVAWLCGLSGFATCPACRTTLIPLDHLSYGE